MKFNIWRPGKTCIRILFKLVHKFSICILPAISEITTIIRCFNQISLFLIYLKGFECTSVDIYLHSFIYLGYNEKDSETLYSIIL